MPVKNFFRTPFNLGDFNDDTRILEPSMTDPSQDETIDQLVSRMMRGELLAAANATYDFEEGTKDAPGDAFAALPIHTRQGFDIADVAPILDAAAKAAASAPVPPVAPEPPKEPDSTVSGESTITTT